MEQVLLITAYKEFDYLRRFAKFISSNGLAAVIHIDKKTVEECILTDLNNMPNVIAISEYVVPWGGIQHVYAVLKLMEIAIENYPELKYIHVITGQDVMCRNVNEFKTFFSEAEKNYMSISDASQSNSFRYKVYYRNDWLDYKTTIGNIMTKALYLLQRVMFIKRKIPNGWHGIYKGMLYVSITNQFVRYVLDYCRTTEGNEFLHWIKWCFIPEEFFFQTLLMNSDYKNTAINNNYRYALWECKYGSQPGVLDELDYDTILNYPCFFARKIDSRHSTQLLNLLEQL